jgi:hypothetical protein
MAKLPRSPIAQEVRNNYQPVREARMDDSDPVGRATQQAGSAVFEIGARLADSKIASDAADASIRLRSRLDEEYRLIETDTVGDPAGLESRFRLRASEIVNEEAAQMSSPALKRAFGTKAAESVESFSISMRDVTRKRQVEGAKSDTIRVASSYEALANDPSKPRELLEESRDDYLSLIERQYRLGIYGKDDVEQLKLGAQKAYEKGVSTRHLTTVDTLIDAGRYGEAEEYFKVSYGEIDPTVRQKAEEALETAVQQGKAVTTADQLWAEAGGDYGAFIAKAREISNPDERLAVEGRGAVLKNQDDAAKSAADQALLEEGMGFIVDGRSLPSDLLRRASPMVIDRLQSEQRTRALWNQQMAAATAQKKAAMRQSSAVAKDYFKGFAVENPEAYLAPMTQWSPDMLQVWDELMPEHKSEILADIQTRQAGGGTFNAADAVFKDLTAQIDFVGPSNMRGKDFVGASTSTGSALKEEQAVKAALFRQAQEFAKRTGGAPITPQESKVMIARAFREADPKRYPFEERGRFNELTANAVAATPAYQETRAYLAEKLGREPTANEVVAMMRAAAEQ